MAEASYNSSLPPGSRGKIENRNFLSPIGFEFLVDKLPGAYFFCQSASIPAISMETVIQPTSVNKVYQPGDELNYEPLFIRFLVDENMKNYYQVHDWIRRIATPVEQKEFTFDRQYPTVNPAGVDYDGYYNNNWRSDVSLIVMSSNYQPVSEFIFKDAFPISLTTLNFNAAESDINYFTAEVAFRYDWFDYRIKEAAEATDISMPYQHISERGDVLLPQQVTGQPR